MKQMNVFWLCLFAISLVISEPTSANTVEIKPILSLKMNYSDNILFSEGQVDTDLITTVSGGLAIRQKTEKMNANFEANLNQVLYQEFDELNSLDNTFSGAVNYRLTHRLGINASGRYRKDSQRDRETDTTGLLVSGDRISTNLSISTNYFFSETLQGDITLNLGAVETDESDQNEDNDQFGIDISFSKNLSQWFNNTTGLLNLNYLHYTSNVGSVTRGSVLTAGGDVSLISSSHQKYASDIFQFSTGFSKELTSKYIIYCMAGASYTKIYETLTEQSIEATEEGTIQEWEPQHTDGKDTIWGGVLSSGINYTGFYYNMGLSLSQDIRGASGTNGAVQRSSVSGNIHRKVTDNLTLSVNASCYLNWNKRKTQSDTKDFTLNFQPGFKYKFTRDFILTGGYGFTYVRDMEDQTTRTRNMIYLIFQKEFEL